MHENNLRYQPVINPDGSAAIHETLIDREGNVKSATYEPVRLESTSLGELEYMLRLIYRQLMKIKPITAEELESLVYGSESIELDVELAEDNVIDLIDYLAR